MRIVLVAVALVLAGGIFFLRAAPSVAGPRFSGDLAGLERAPKFELTALDPMHNNKVANFHGYPILGTTTVEKPDEKTALLTALKRSIEESDGSAAMCFNPRHGLRATVGGKTVDLVICFECYQINVYPDSADEKKVSSVLIAPSARATFEDLLVKAGAIPASRIKEEPAGTETKGGK